MSRRVGNEGRVVAALGLLVLAACAGAGASGSAGAGVIPDAGRDAAVMAVLDRYMAALNDLDIEGHVSTYHFPHYRHASGRIVIWRDAEEAMPILGVPEAERRAALRAALEPDWQRSEWTRREIVQASDEKVHVVTRFERLRADGSLIRAFDSLYVLTRQDGRWGIKGRSSFAP